MAERPDGFRDSDQQWFDRLRGGAAPVDGARAAREADALRLALQDAQQRLQAQAAAEPDDAEAAAFAWQRLQFRLRREAAAAPPQPARRLAWTAGLAATLVLGVGLVPLLRDSLGLGDEAPPVMRGEHRLVERRVAAPRQAAEQLAQALRDAGLTPTLYRQAGVYSVDLLLAPDALAAAVAPLQPLGLVPSPGLLRVVFLPAAASAP